MFYCFFYNFKIIKPEKLENKIKLEPEPSLEILDAESSLVIIK